MAVSFFTFGLCFCVMYPFILVLVLLLFICQFYVDKYNLMYIYPLEFESQTLSRKTLVKNSFYAVILFQLCMIGAGTLGQEKELLSSKAIIYLASFVAIQLVVIIMMFEFLRKPWDGAEIELERVLELQ